MGNKPPTTDPNLKKSDTSAQQQGASTTSEEIVDEAELLERPDVHLGKPLSVRQGEARAGQEFDRAMSPNYPYNQLPIRDQAGKLRWLDSYDPIKKEIVSRKSLAATQGQIAHADEFTMIGHFQEFALKYPNGAVIADVPSARAMGLAGQTMTGSYILEVPVQRWAIPDRILEEARLRHVTIRDVNGKVY